MKNTTRYFELVTGFRAALNLINEKFAPEYERLARFKDSKSYPEDKKRLDDARKALVDEIRQEALAELDATVSNMEATYQNKPATAPTPEQLSLLEVLRMKSTITRDEARRAAKSLEGCPLAMSVLEDLCRKNGCYLSLVKELSSDAIAANLRYLRLYGSILIGRLERPGIDRVTAANSGDWDIFRIDADFKTERDVFRAFGFVGDFDAFAEAVNE